ncbi:MAG: GMC family oxidoreductase N-terminal domain-containing protein [Rhizobiaceae bacterium]|nr:GMC family oxidoreductase N-terminal domain-containing protein [Rhizobiaceae bacterium]
MADKGEGADTFDYIVVGAGTAGCIVASRLSEDGASVCLIEAGHSDTNALIHIPAGFIKNAYSKNLTWNFQSVPSNGSGGRSLILPQGRVVGGSSSINGMNHVRGQPLDYDGWAQRGNPGWSYQELLPYFKRSERKIGVGDNCFRGRTGELPVTDLQWRHPICDSFIEGAHSIGIPRNVDYNGPVQAGAGYFQQTTLNGFRYSSARAFLKAARRRRNFHIRTRALVTAIRFEGKRAAGITYVPGDGRHPARQIAARREVILCAGAINTPKLMQLSGLGPADLLAQHGIPVVCHIPGVGNHLRDHYGVRLVAKLEGKDVATINNIARGLPLAGQVARWVLRRPSILSMGPSPVYVFWKSEPFLAMPDLEYVFTPASFQKGIVGLLDRFPGMTLGVWPERPESLGYVRISSSDPLSKPQIQPNYLSAEGDRQTLLRGMRLGLQLLTTPALRQYDPKIIAPDPEAKSDAELLDFAHQNGTTIYHMIGTARMGPESDSDTVVDAQLRVHGIEGLRVADASIMPTMPSANTNATVMMIAEKAADLVRGRAALEPNDV